MKLHYLEGQRLVKWRKGTPGKRGFHPSKLKGEERQRAGEKTYIPTGSIIKTGDNKYVMGFFFTKCGSLSFLEMGPQGDRPRKRE